MAEATKDKGAYHEQRQQPADVTFQAQHDIEKGSESNIEKPAAALEEAVDDLDSGLAIRPNQ